MKKYLILTFTAITVIIVGCDKKQTLDYPESPEIFGLATPIELDYNETTVVLDDYFLDISNIDSFSIPEYLSYKLTGDDFEFLTLNTKDSEIPVYGELNVWVGGFPYSILLKKNRKINHLFQFDPAGINYKKVQITGTMNEWNPANTNLQLIDGLWQTSFILNPGVFQYQLVLDDKWVLDPNNPNKADNNIGGVNSLMTVGNTNYENLPAIFTQSENENIKIGYDQQPEETFIFWENSRLNERFVLPVENGFEIKIPADAKKLDRSFIRIWSYNENGPSNELLIPLANGKVITDPSLLTREDKHATILYFMMIDRFNNGNRENDDPIDDPDIAVPANYNGGDIAGITQKIKEGYFTDLNINSIWLSPITQNPLTGFVEYPAPHRKYSGYHGYWPITLTTLDHRFGTEAELDELVKEAHSRGMNVLLDYV